VRGKFHALITVLLTMMFLTVAPVLAVKPAGNIASAEKVPWNLSAEVMKVPPYGSRDIPGSDDASKLIVNQPNGEVEVTITGAMNGLHPCTTYTVYLSKEYTLTYHRWSLKGTWKLGFLWGGYWYHDMWITEETDTTFSGTGAWPSGGPYGITWVVTGTKSGSGITITMLIDYDGSPYLVTASGTIAPDGTLSGTWTSNAGQGPSTWQSFEGAATYLGDVGTGWSGLFNPSTVPAFTFTTDEYGSGSWHLNLRDSDFPKASTYTLSVWINEAGSTILISDNFSVVVNY